MPASWNSHQERMYKGIVRSCRSGGRGLGRCKSMAAATVNKYRSTHGFAGLGAKLPGYKRRDYCLPGRTRSLSKYPVSDCRHAKNALSRASAAYNEGYLSRRNYAKVRKCAYRFMRRNCG